MDFGVLILIVGGVFGWVFGYFIGRMLERNTQAEMMQSVGTLHVETTDPDGPYLFLELSTDVSEVCSKEKVVLDVDTKSYISQD